MNTLYKRNDINKEGYILCVGDNNEIPICIQKDNVYPFEIYSFEDILDEYPETFTKLASVAYFFVGLTIEISPNSLLCLRFLCYDNFKIYHIYPFCKWFQAA